MILFCRAIEVCPLKMKYCRLIDVSDKPKFSTHNWLIVMLWKYTDGNFYSSLTGINAFIRKELLATRIGRELEERNEILSFVINYMICN